MYTNVSSSFGRFGLGAAVVSSTSTASSSSALSTGVVLAVISSDSEVMGAGSLPAPTALAGDAWLDGECLAECADTSAGNIGGAVPFGTGGSTFPAASVTSAAHLPVSIGPDTLLAGDVLPFARSESVGGGAMAMPGPLGRPGVAAPTTVAPPDVDPAIDPALGGAAVAEVAAPRMVSGPASAAVAPLPAEGGPCPSKRADATCVSPPPTGCCWDVPGKPVAPFAMPLPPTAASSGSPIAKLGLRSGLQTMNAPLAALYQRKAEPIVQERRCIPRPQGATVPTTQQ